LAHCARFNPVLKKTRRHSAKTTTSLLISDAIGQCRKLEIKTLFAILLDIHRDGTRILGKFDLEQWGHLPGIADFGERECGHSVLRPSGKVSISWLPHN
jgi:hypothetical protein